MKSGRLKSGRLKSGRLKSGRSNSGRLKSGRLNSPGFKNPKLPPSRIYFRSASCATSSRPPPPATAPTPAPNAANRSSLFMPVVPSRNKLGTSISPSVSMPSCAPIALVTGLVRPAAAADFKTSSRSPPRSPVIVPDVKAAATSSGVIGKLENCDKVFAMFAVALCAPAERFDKNPDVSLARFGAAPLAAPEAVFVTTLDRPSAPTTLVAGVKKSLIAIGAAARAAEVKTSLRSPPLKPVLAPEAKPAAQGLPVRAAPIAIEFFKSGSKYFSPKSGSGI